MLACGGAGLRRPVVAGDVVVGAVVVLGAVVVVAPVVVVVLVVGALVVVAAVVVTGALVVAAGVVAVVAGGCGCAIDRRVRHDSRVVFVLVSRCLGGRW
jgi:hypothetical protein